MGRQPLVVAFYPSIPLFLFLFPCGPHSYSYFPVAPIPIPIPIFISVISAMRIHGLAVLKPRLRGKQGACIGPTESEVERVSN